MPGKNSHIPQMASVRGDVERRCADVVSQIIDLSWDYAGQGFSFAEHPELEREVNRLLVSLSDGMLSDATLRAQKALIEDGLDDWEDEAAGYASGERGGEPIVQRLDKHCDHLKELVALWLIAGAVSGLSKGEVVRQMFSHQSNPSMSASWKEAGLSNPQWGRGYMIDTVGGMTVVLQDYISRIYQYSVLQGFAENGAIGYRTVRNSGYDCPYCDEMCTKIWPLDEVVLPYHPRCVCLAVPVYKNDSI